MFDNTVDYFKRRFIGEWKRTPSLTVPSLDRVIMRKYRGSRMGKYIQEERAGLKKYVTITCEFQQQHVGI
jgi:hypothetical protein